MIKIFEIEWDEKKILDIELYLLDTPHIHRVKELPKQKQPNVPLIGEHFKQGKFKDGKLKKGEFNAVGFCYQIYECIIDIYKRLDSK